MNTEAFRSDTSTDAEARARLLLAVRQGGVTDTHVLATMESIPRPMFVPKPFRERSFENVALPIGRHQTVSQPLVVGLMTQALELTDRMKVLEIGTGSGYQAAILAKLCRRLYTIERHGPLLKDAEARFRELRLTNVTAILGDGSKGWKEQAPFDRIILTAAALDIPAQLVDQLAVGGIMVLPVGLDNNDQRLIRLIKTGQGAETEDMGGVRFVPLLPGVEAE